MTDDHNDPIATQRHRRTSAYAPGPAVLPRAPAEPPRVSLAAGAGEPAVVGKLMAADWKDLTPGLDLHPEESVIWPDPAHRKGRTTFEITSEAKPHWLDVAIFAVVDPVSGIPIDPETNEPAEYAEHEFSCRENPFIDGRMKLQDGITRFKPFPDEPLAHEYVTVYARWTLIHTKDGFDDTGKPHPGDLSASWMFHFVNE